MAPHVGVRLLDLFAGAGGSAAGYVRAGFTDVVGVDIRPQPHYPYAFIQADWEEAIHVLPGLWEREGVAYAIHASPPCQRYSPMTKKWGRSAEHPDLIGPVREALEAVDVPWVIENVPGSPLQSPVLLCGSMFGLGDSSGRQLRRHRLFESSADLGPPPGPCRHRGQAVGVYGHPGGSSVRDGIQFAQFGDWRDAMGIDWMTVPELTEAIPPAYTEWVGSRLLGAAEPLTLGLEWAG